MRTDEATAGTVERGERQLLTGNHAVSYGAMLAGNANGGIVISAYPITPQTDIVKRLSDMVADGTLSRSRFIPVESEHSALAVILAASMAGARAFTATSSHGLLLMGELMWWAAGSRAPLVLANVNRAIAPGWSIWTDQQDSLSMRDTGWLQYYCADNQEVLDSVLLGFRIGEALRLPVMVVLDAFVLSHTSEELWVPSLDTVRRFLPPFRPELRLDPRRPRIFGGLTVPELYPSFRRKIDRAMARVPDVEGRAEAEFAELFGRRYAPVVGYRTEDAEVVLVASATVARTARVAIDALRNGGVKVGVIRVRRFRPFPSAALRAALADVPKVAVVDRNVSLGGEGIFATELKAALYGSDSRPQVHTYIAGLGGRDVTVDVLTEIVMETGRSRHPSPEPRWIGVLPEDIASHDPVTVEEQP
jgi:pyruvate/2-oxoacid:ferredoxin oxidoreductase alpha subunit